jgi:quercetin dioxygenase-like cupin family protein
LAYKGQTIHNNITGETLTFLETAADTNGEKLIFDLVLKPGSTVPMKHTHTKQDEIFELISGTVHIEVGAGHKLLKSGEKAIMPKKIPHRWWNDTNEEAKLTVTFIPAHNTEDFFVEMFALASGGKTKPNGSPTFRQAAVMCGKYDIYHPTIPVILQKTISALAKVILKSK